MILLTEQTARPFSQPRMAAPIPTTEKQRLAALQRYRILDTAPEEEFDDLVRLASQLCGVPMALITLVDEKRQWFKAKVGIDRPETPREHAFCAHTILGKDVMIVQDARSDERFSSNPLVTGEPHIQFYAGAPLRNREGHALGSLCIIDQKVRELATQEVAALEALARVAMRLIEQRQSSAELAEALENVRVLGGLVPICSYCRNIRNDEGYWKSVEEFLATRADIFCSHSICPNCVKERFPSTYEKLVREGKLPRAS